MLGAIESLMSAVVADRMTRDRHNPNVELIAQGIANIFHADGWGAALRRVRLLERPRTFARAEDSGSPGLFTR